MQPCCMITWILVGGWFMHSRWRRVVGEREAEKARSLDPQITLVLALVGVLLDFSTVLSSRRGTNAQVILLFP